MSEQRASSHIHSSRPNDPLKSKELTPLLNTLRAAILVLICSVAIICRLFSVIRYESIIHEFDPWFNYRATIYLVEHGWYAFINWFDDTVWYPLGRVVGGSVYPGLMVTSAAIFTFLKDWIHIPVDIRHVCVFLAPVFSAFTALATYGFAMEIEADPTAGLLSAAFMGIVPGYISRSVAGSYDNEGISIFLLMITFYFWLKAVKGGSPFYAMITAFFYFYMVSAWGGYVFIINLIPLHVFTLLLMGRFTWKVYSAYSTFYVLGTIASMLIPFVGVNPSRTSDHMAALGTFGLVQIVAIAYGCKPYLKASYNKFLIGYVTVISLLVALALVGLHLSGLIAPWTGRFYSLWDTSYARKHIPIIASVSEHQPTCWSSFFFDLQVLVLLFPAGVYFCLADLHNEGIFLVLYSITASYFAGVMVRLMLTLTPIVCVAAAIALSRLLKVYSSVAPATLSVPESSSSVSLKSVSSNSSQGSKRRSPVPELEEPISNTARWSVFLAFYVVLIYFVRHCTYVTSTAYSSPSVILSSYDHRGNPVIIDDFREAYYWLRKNTPASTKILSWWDYGYQIAGFSDRITIVDNNTWNNTHIALVGKVLGTPEPVAHTVCTDLEVDYVLVLCGGVSGYSGDDINKFIWMIRIAEGIFPDDLNESAFYNAEGHYRVDEHGSQTLRDSLLYKLSYYRMDDIMGGTPEDRARGSPLPKPSPSLDYFEEAFSSEHYIVRIYRVKKADPLGRRFENIRDFSSDKK